MGGETGSVRIKRNGVKFVKTTAVSNTELCVGIPECLLLEVMIRLPVKLVFRCKLVCKQWLSIISDPCFVGMFVSRASLSPQSQIWTFIYFFMHVDGNPTQELLDDAYSHDLKCPSLLMLRCPPSMRHHKIVGVSNGLVLTRDRLLRYPSYNIYNPITKKSILLPPHARRFKIDRCYLVTRVENGVLSSCRLVRIEVRPRSSNMMRFEVFVSEINKWKAFDVYTDQAIQVLTWQEMPTTLNGVLHWVTRKHGIMAYDSYQNPDSLRFITLPRDTDPTCNDEHIGIPSLCDAHQGRLRYFEVSNTFMPPHGFSSFGIWMLNDYSNGDWCLQHRISSGDIIYDDFLTGSSSFLEPIFFHPFDPEIVYLEYKNVLVSFNIKTRKLEAHGNISSKGWCTFLLVIPPWPVSVAPSKETYRISKEL